MAAVLKLRVARYTKTDAPVSTRPHSHREQFITDVRKRCLDAYRLLMVTSLA